MIPFRLQVKYFLENPQAVDVGAFIGLFQRWIQQNPLPEMLIDVADYRHVVEGPGVLLVGHRSDFAMESADGRLGLLYTRKREADGSLQDQLRSAFRITLTACKLLEADSTFNPKLKFRADEVEIRFVDRLQLPNQPETLDKVRDDVSAVLAELYDGARVSFAPLSTDPRHVFTLSVQAEGATSVAALLDHLKPDPQALANG